MTVEVLPALGVSRRAQVAGWARWGFELLVLLAIGGALLFDRVRLVQEYLSKFVDEDQGIEWYAAREALAGRFHEPCFFGQAYNSNIEGYLAAPLVWMKAPYEIAVPVVTVMLGLLPFLLIAWCAWRRRQGVVAGLALLVPVVLSTRYGVITGMPRGFVTGVAVAILPALLFCLAAAGKRKKLTTENAEGAEVVEGEGKKKAERLKRSWPKARYFLAAFLAVVALMFNPYGAVLLLPVAVYGVLTTFLEWRFWVFTFLGLAAAAPYPWFVYQFYYVWHKDYAIYPTGDHRDFSWSWGNFYSFLHNLDFAFRDLVPNAVYQFSAELMRWIHTKRPGEVTTWGVRNPASMALAVLFAGLFIILIVRLRLRAFPALAAWIAGVGLIVVSFAWERVNDARPGVSFPYARMFLAVPVLWLWLMLLMKRVNAGGIAQRVRRGWWGFVRNWVPMSLSAIVLILCVAAGWRVALAKNAVLSSEIVTVNKLSQVARPVELAEAKQIAQKIDEAVKAHPNVSLVLIVGFDGRKWDYVLPELTTCETLFPSFERRTWRMVEESVPRHEEILVLGSIPVRGLVRVVPTTRISQDPPLAIYKLGGKSVIEFCRAMNISMRAFTAPPVSVPSTRPTTNASTQRR